MGVALLVAFALSLDGFGVGMAYGIKNIKIPFWSMCIIGLCTVAAMGVSMLIPYLDIISPQILGAAILIAIGGFQFAKAVFPNNTAFNNKDKIKEDAVPVIASNSAGIINENQQLFRLDLSIFGLVIQILKTPAVADIDNSGTISIPESILLGLALSVDAISSGLAATMAGIPSYSIVLVALIQYFMIRIGLSLAEKLSPGVLKRAKVLPGILLVLVGLFKMI
jgi:putative sporulation protein YtaF